MQCAPTEAARLNATVVFIPLFEKALFYYCAVDYSALPHQTPMMKPQMVFHERGDEVVAVVVIGVAA